MRPITRCSNDVVVLPQYENFHSLMSFHIST